MSTGYNVPAGQQIDGVYDYTKPWRGGVPSDVVQPRWTYAGPWASNEERLTQQALMVATIPGTELSELVRPNLPQIRLFPDRFGYGERPQPGIDDVVSIDRVYTEPRVSWYSGGVAGYSGSSRNSLEGI
jgi:hypothetical protein